MATCIAITQLSIAQSPLGEDVWIDIGETENVQLMDMDAGIFFSGPSGENVSWDFSSLPANSDVCTYEAMPMNLSPYRHRFPNADMFYVCVLSAGGSDMIEVHTFYSKEGSTVSFEGTATISVTAPEFDSIFLQYQDPQTFLRFPFSYLDSYTDDYTGTLTTYAAQMITINIEGMVTSTAESHGTLITPAGEFDDCIRIKRTELESIMVEGIPLTTEQESHRYTWATSDENYLLLNLDSLVTKDFLGNPVATTYAGMYRLRGPTTSSFEILEKYKDIKVFPNPIVDQVNIEFPSSLEKSSKIIITDMMGRPYTAKILNKNKRIQIDMSLFPQGSYILSWEDEGSRVSIPLFKM